MAKLNSQNMGSGGYCICTKCNYKSAHNRGVPCQEERCPDCGTKLMREGSNHHKLFQEKQKK